MNLQPMKAITLWQPWASLVACGAKPDETRSWPTKYRGPIAIHAAVILPARVMKKVFPLGDWNYHPDYHAKQEFLKGIRSAFNNAYKSMDDLPTGCIIATAELVECWKVIEHTPTAIVLKQSNGVGEDKLSISDPRLPFGDYSIGRYIWGFADINRLPEPIPAKGRQGLWNWNGAEHEA